MAELIKPIKKEIAPLDLLHWNRFDVMFKYLYGLSRKKGWDTGFFESMYHHHIKIWNGFSEYDDESKNTYTLFRSRFDNLLDEIEQKGFDSARSLVAVADDKYLLNGAHRLSACLLGSRDISYFDARDGQDGQLDCSWEFFSKLTEFGAISRDYADRAALEFARLKKSSRMVILYPSATRQGRLNDVRTILLKYSNIVYEKQINIGRQGSVNLMRELYAKEDWGEANNGEGYAVKADFCYQPRGIFRRIAPTQVYLMDFSSNDEANRAKDDIRSIYNIDKHSIHINDTHEETVRLAKCLFNENSIHFLNKFNGRFYPRFETLLEEFKSWIERDGLDSDDYCVSAGSVLTAYGLKECKDIDYLHSDSKEYQENELIQSHNLYGVDRYHTVTDDIVHNPENHFYRYGIKYASLNVVRQLKERRGEPKDKKDLKLIKGLR